MSQRDDLIAKYAEDLRTKCGVESDMDLLTKVTIGLGPTIYNKDSATVASSDPAEVDRVKTNFLMKKLGLTEDDDLDGALAKVFDTYGKSNPTKHRAVICYLLVVHFNKQDVYA